MKAKIALGVAAAAAIPAFAYFMFNGYMFKGYMFMGYMFNGRDKKNNNGSEIKGSKQGSQALTSSAVAQLAATASIDELAERATQSIRTAVRRLKEAKQPAELVSSIEDTIKGIQSLARQREFLQIVQRIQVGDNRNYLSKHLSAMQEYLTHLQWSQFEHEAQLDMINVDSNVSNIKQQGAMFSASQIKVLLMFGLALAKSTISYKNKTKMQLALIEVTSYLYNKAEAPAFKLPSITTQSKTELVKLINECQAQFNEAQIERFNIATKRMALLHVGPTDDISVQECKNASFCAYHQILESMVKILSTTYQNTNVKISKLFVSKWLIDVTKLKESDPGVSIEAWLDKTLDNFEKKIAMPQITSKQVTQKDLMQMNNLLDKYFLRDLRQELAQYTLLAEQLEKMVQQVVGVSLSTQPAPPQPRV